jgi:hypothetical protein
MSIQYSGSAVVNGQSGTLTITLQTASFSSFSISYGTPFKYNSNYPTKYITGDSFATTWADDDLIYTMSDDSHGFQGGSDSNIQFGLLSASDTTMTGTTINIFSVFGPNNTKGSDGGTYKANGLISVNGTLYMWVSRQGTQLGSPPAGVTTEANAQLIKSSDHGATWTPLPTNGTAQPYTSTMFTGKTFAAPNFIQYGKDYQGNSADNSGNYVYATANDGCWNNCSKLFLGRCLISNLSNLSGADWSFYQGGDGMLSGNWGAWSTAAALISSPFHIGNISQAQYIQAWRVYFWIGWYYPSVQGTGVIDPSTTVWNFYTSPHPWGPYTLQYTQTWSSEPGKGLYSPNIITKSILVSGNRLTANITTSGDFNTYADPMGDYTLTIVPLVITAS